MGTRTLSSPKINLKMTGTVQNTLTDSSVASIGHPNLSYAPTLTSGVSASQTNRAWQSKSRSLAGGASETLDLYDLAGVDIGAGAALDGVGQVVSPFEEIVAIAIVNENAVGAAGQLEVEPGAGTGWSPIGTHTAATGGALRGQGCLFKAQVAENGFDITDGASHLLKMTANGGDVVYSIYIFARHDDNESSSSSSTSSSQSASSSSSSSSSSQSASSQSNESSSSQSVSSSSSISTSSSWSSGSSTSSISTSSLSMSSVSSVSSSSWSS